jgi:2-oxoglutarate ferredoxin oxidoreductase subunit beta
MSIVYQKSQGLTDVCTHYCPGCTHGIIHKLVAECLVELGVLDKSIGVAPVGCAVLAYDYFNCDMQEAAHGRAPAVATGIKRVLPDRMSLLIRDSRSGVQSRNEMVQVAHRGEKISTEIRQ